MVDHSDLQCSPGVRAAKMQPDWSAEKQTKQQQDAGASWKSKDGARTINAWREQWRQLGLQAWSADSDSRRETQNPRSLSQEHLEELQATARKGDEDFRAWERDQWGGLAKVRKRIQVLARNVHFAPQQGDIQRMVQAAEHDLRIFAEQTRQEEDELASLECSLQDTLESSLARFEGWCSQETALRKPVGKPARPPSCSRARQSETNSVKDAKQLDSMHEQLDKLEANIANDGGSTGGWSYDDHDTFVRVFHKFKRKTGVEFITEAQQLLPDKRHEDLVCHVSWMLLYEDRQLQKRQLVEQWRCMRAAVTNRERTMEPKQGLTAEAAREEKRQRACLQEHAQKELSERRQHAAEWRHARDAEQRTQQEEQRRRAQEAQKDEIQERQRQNEQRHRAIEAMREQRAADESLIGTARRNSAPASGVSARAVSCDDKKRIAERNAALLQKRAAQVQAKRREEQDVQQFAPPPRASSVGAHRHVESRIEESTRLYVDRSRELREDLSIAGQPTSKYGVVPGNFAHQGMVRTLRSAASWRPHFGA